MPITPEDRARQNIDKLLADAGWIVQDKRQTNLSAGRGVAVREFPLKPSHGEADYLLFVDSAPVGVVEAKKEGDTLTGQPTRKATKPALILLDFGSARVIERHKSVAKKNCRSATILTTAFRHTLNSHRLAALGLHARTLSRKEMVQNQVHSF